MTNPNQPNRIHNLPPSKRNFVIGALATGALLGAGLDVFINISFDNGSHESNTNNSSDTYTTALLKAAFHYTGSPQIAPSEPNDQLRIVSNINEKAGEAVALSLDGGRDWRLIPVPPVDALKNGSVVVGAEFAPTSIQGSSATTGTQVFEVTRTSNNSKTVTLEMDEIVNGQPQLVDTTQGNITLNSPGSWFFASKALNFAISSIKPGNSEPDTIDVSTSGKHSGNTDYPAPQIPF